MQTLFYGLLGLHITFASLALLSLVFPSLSRKGGTLHKRSGRFYHHNMVLVSAAGLAMSLLTLAAPDSARADAMAASADPDRTRALLQTLNVLLAHLALLTYRSVRHGQLALQCKHNRAALRRWPEVAGNGLLVITGLLVLALGVHKGLVLLMIFGPLGSLIAASMLWFSFKPALAPREWLTEHLGGYIGSAIGAITAFFAFGGRSLFADSGNLQLFLWIAPGVLGAILIAWLNRRYRSSDRPASIVGGAL